MFNNKQYKALKHLDENLNEAKSKDVTQLQLELDEIKEDYEDFGADGLYSVKLTRFLKQFPEFTKSCIMSYLKELEILTPEEIEDTESLNQYWQEGELITREDWPCLLEGADLLSQGRNIQWEKLWKKYYNRGTEE